MIDNSALFKIGYGLYVISYNDGKNDNNGEYHNTRNVDRTEKPDIEKIAKFNKQISNIISSTLKDLSNIVLNSGLSAKFISINIL